MKRRRKGIEGDEQRREEKEKKLAAAGRTTDKTSEDKTERETTEWSR